MHCDGRLETQEIRAAETMLMGLQDEGSLLFSPLLIFLGGWVSKLTIICSLIFSLFSPLIKNWL